MGMMQLIDDHWSCSPPSSFASDQQIGKSSPPQAKPKRAQQLPQVPTHTITHLPHTLQNNVRFEASGICIAKDFAWVVFDSFRDIARLDLHFNYFGDDNIMVRELCHTGLLLAPMIGAVGSRHDTAWR